MIYGKVETADPPMPQIGGNYTGTIVNTTNVPAVFEWNPNSLEAKLSGGGGVFKGMYAQGYFCGPTRGSNGNGLAAVTLLPDGTLDGVFLPMPFTAMNKNFDFKPGQ